MNKQVLQSDVEAQQNVAPFLRHRVLREIVKSFTNSPNDDFEAWAKNQQAIDTLKEAQRLLDNGYISEEDMEHSLLAHLQVSRTNTALLSRSACKIRFCPSKSVSCACDSAKPPLPDVCRGSQVKMEVLPAMIQLDETLEARNWLWS